MRNTMLTRLMALACLGTLLLTVAGGCTNLDKRTFHSTVNLPVTVALVDPYTRQDVWVKEVPVHQSLVLDLQRPGDVDYVKFGKTPATELEWYIYPTQEHSILPGKTRLQEGKQRLPGSNIYVDVRYRPAPEYPPHEILPAVQPPVDRPAATPRTPTSPTPTAAAPATPAPASPATLTIDLLADGSAYIAKQPFTHDQLRSTLELVARNNPEARVVIQADRNTPAASVTRVVDVARQAGIRNLLMANTGSPIGTPAPVAPAPATPPAPSTPVPATPTAPAPTPTPVPGRGALDAHG